MRFATLVDQAHNAQHDPRRGLPCGGHIEAVAA
jgi:hypothetical protein